MAWSEPQSATWEDFRQAWLRARVDMLRPAVKAPDGLLTTEDGRTVAYVLEPLDLRATPPAPGR